jgi:hypothetical protein
VALSLGVKRPGLEADHLFPSNAEVQNDGAILINALRGFPQSFQADAAIVSQYGHDFLPYAFPFINLAIQSEIRRSEINYNSINIPHKKAKFVLSCNANLYILL